MSDWPDRERVPAEAIDSERAYVVVSRVGRQHRTLHAPGCGAVVQASDTDVVEEPPTDAEPCERCLGDGGPDSAFSVLKNRVGTDMARRLMSDGGTASGTADTPADDTDAERITMRFGTTTTTHLDRVVESGLYISRSEAVRDAVRRVVRGRLELTDELQTSYSRLQPSGSADRITVRMPPPLVAALDALADQHDDARSVIVRVAVRQLPVGQAGGDDAETAAEPGGQAAASRQRAAGGVETDD